MRTWDLSGLFLQLLVSLQLTKNKKISEKICINWAPTNIQAIYRIGTRIEQKQNIKVPHDSYIPVGKSRQKKKKKSASMTDMG